MSSQARAIRWAAGYDTGTSSKTIWVAMMGGIDVPRRLGGLFDIPLDASDFGRCHRLLKIVPEWRENLEKVTQFFPAWKPFVDAWEELENLYEKELPRADGRAPQLYERIQQLKKESRALDGRKETDSEQGPRASNLAQEGALCCD